MYCRLIVVVLLLVLNSGWAVCSSCMTSARQAVEGGSPYYLKVSLKQELAPDGNRTFFLASIDGVAKCSCDMAGDTIILLADMERVESCVRPALKAGGTYAVPLSNVEVTVTGYNFPVFRVRPCNYFETWSQLSASDATYLNGMLCAKPMTPVPLSCPPMETPGLLQSNNLNCGTKPTRKDVVVKPSDNVRDVVQGASKGSFIFFSRGTYSIGIENILPPSRVTLWADPGTVTFQGGSRSRAFFFRRSNVNVRIFGIQFEGYKVGHFDGVISASTNGAMSAFNATSDPLYGFNPSNGWVVDCCTFKGWTCQNSGNTCNAISCGSGMIIRGTTLQDGAGLGISCFAKEVTIDGNRFERIQMQEPFESAHCGAIKITGHKHSKVTNNYFKDVGSKAIWLDNNCENVYVAHNEAYNLGRSFVHVEIGGAGTVVEYNKVVGFGWNEVVGGGAWVKAAAFWVSTSGGTEAPPSQQGNIIRGNYVKQIQKNASAKERSGFLDLDQWELRNIVQKDSLAHTKIVGRIPDASGSTQPGLKYFSSNYNKFIGNTAIGVYRNGIAAMSSTYSRPDQTDVWFCNQLEGEFKVVP